VTATHATRVTARGGGSLGVTATARVVRCIAEGPRMVSRIAMRTSRPRLPEPPLLAFAPSVSLTWSRLDTMNIDRK
jgi:hypothetical protein